MNLLGLLVAIILLGVLWWAMHTILGVIPIAEPFKTVAYVLLVVIAVVIVLEILVGIPGVVLTWPRLK